MTEQERVEKVAKAIAKAMAREWDDPKTQRDLYRMQARVAFAALTVTPQEGRSLPDRIMVWHSSPTLDHLGTWATTRYPVEAKAYVRADDNTSQTTPQEAAKVSEEARENIVDEIESIICETHEMDVRDVDYAENIVSWLERHHPAALRAISEDSHE
ncbi:hypothetical protein [Sulfitobacter sp. PS-8MA]|uniref:hypothetical protein n=1 Tax=Sulfitobacter sp. PS-8MA TaxID=3237707 RepID=UPI0034C686EB